MKNIANMMVAFLIGAVGLICMILIAARNDRQMELENMLPSAVEEAVSTAFLKEQYKISDAKELAADIRESIAQAIDSDGDITVDILKCDREKGLCSVVVTADYKHLNGKDARVSCERTVILDKGSEQAKTLCQIVFYESQGGECYKKILAELGETIAEPSLPLAEGKTFVRWIDESGNTPDFTQPIAGDKVYYAEWN